MADRPVIYVALTAALVAATAVGVGAWVALRWPEPRPRRVVHDSPAGSAVYAVGLVLVGVAFCLLRDRPVGQRARPDAGCGRLDRTPRVQPGGQTLRARLCQSRFGCASSLRSAMSRANWHSSF